MPQCVVPNCLNRTEKGVRLFKFPQGDSNEERRKLWIRSVNRTELPQNSFLCEVHFENDQFENDRLDQKRLLKADAVPTIFPNKSKMFAESDQNESNDDSESQGEIRRSSRKRKPIKFEDYDSEGDIENDKEIDDKEAAKENEDKTYMPELIRCRTCLGTEIKESAHIMKKLIYGKTIKQIILICTPELESSILDMECVCQKCFRFLTKLMYFIESCRDSEKKLQSGDISLDNISIDQTKLGSRKSIDSNGEPTVKKKRGRPRKDEQKVVVASETPIKRKRGRPRKVQVEENEEDPNFKVLGSDDPKNVKEYVKKEKDLDAKNISEAIVNRFKETIEFVDQQTNKTEIIQIIFENDNDKSNEQQMEITDSVVFVETSNEGDKDVPNNLETIDSDHSYLPPPIKKLLSCSYCQSDYRTLKGIKTHLTQVHGIQVDQDTECSLCKMKFIRYKDMIRHKVSHGHICLQCDKNFTTRAELEVHQTIHPDVFSCTQCGMKFKTEELLKKHTPLHLMMTQICTQIQSNSVECPSCDMQFSSEQSVRIHTRLKHSTDLPVSYACSECGQTYKRKDYLDLHLKTHRSRISLFHNPNRKTYSKAFNTAEREYKCLFCETKTNSKEALIEHLSDHTDFRKFHCKHCGLKSSSLQNLSMKFIHEKKHGIYLITCSDCCSKYKNEEQLKKDDENSNTKRFSCNICNDSFTRLAQIECHVLSEHIKKETNLEEKANSVQQTENEHKIDIVNDKDTHIINMEEKNSPKSGVKKGFIITKEDIENDWDSDPESPSPNETELESVETLEQIPPNKEFQHKEGELKKGKEIDSFEESCVSIDLTEEESQECLQR
ncbi:uncharacterized protein [Diabrotica undecimpunctata]|uniref:uncharacterized protein n=1 Tax=Diabrotica undecimpunctata TaxID=50387 RepID=UPI003B635174